MAIIGPSDLPVVLKVPSDGMKKYILTSLGFPTVDVELTEDQMEVILRNTGDFISGYFPQEQRYTWFMTRPMTTTYPMPQGAYWITDVQWDPMSTNVSDIFGVDYYLVNNNAGMLTGGNNPNLTDIHLLQAYRKFSRKVLGTEGHWEVQGEVDGDTTQQTIRLYPTPKGAYPVVVCYYPVVNHFRSPQAKHIANRMLLAEAKCILGRSLRKIAGMPSPDGGTIQMDGDALAQEGKQESEELITKALQLGEPDGVYVW